MKDVVRKLDIFWDYFKTLYAVEVEIEQMEDFLDEIVLPRLLEEDTAMLDIAISPDEIAEAIWRLKSNTAPDLDLFIAEYYNKFKYCLLPYLTELFQACIKGKLPESWRRVKIVVLPKQGWI